MIADGVVEPAAELVDGALEPVVLERRDATAAIADQVMVMVLAAGQGRLVAGRAVADVEPLDESHPLEQLERPVDGRDADRAAAVAELVGDLAGAEDAVLVADQLEHGRPRGARAMAGGAQRLVGAADPVARRVGSVPSTSSPCP